MRRIQAFLLAAIVAVSGYATYVLLQTSQPGRNNGNLPYNRLGYNIGNTQVSNIWPGEFENNQSIWLQWPSDVYNQDSSRPVNPVMANIIKALDPYTRVNIMVSSLDQMADVKSILKSSGYTGNNAHYYVINHLSIWTRDVGPIFVKDSKYMTKVVNFGFNNYSRGGNQVYLNTENQVAPLAAQALHLPVIDSSLTIEGGAIESNGRGTMMVTEAVALKRNPNMTKTQIENEFKRVFGVKKVIWLSKGLAEDDSITTGHINEFARFADPHTIVLAQILPQDRYASWASQESYLRMEQNYNTLKNSTDQDGKPFNIVRIPMPPGLYQEAGNVSSIPVRSYLNYALANGVMLMQTYWKDGRPAALKTTEDSVKNTYRRVFPGRNVIGIDAENVNLWGGGIHCITQHMPVY